MNLKSVSLLSLLLLPLSAHALEQKAPPVAPPDAVSPTLVWDVDPALRQGLPRNFRTTSDPLRPKGTAGLNPIGLGGLHASGSAEFTAASYGLMQGRWHGPVTVFDLRQEDHLFVNGEPVSWYATNNWANVGKTHAAIVGEEQRRAQSLVRGTQLELADDKAKKGEGSGTPPEAITVAACSTESDFVRAQGAAYVRLTVSDHARPTDGEVDRFIEAVRQMPADGWAHFHCRAGKGRTTTFMALYDMLRNAPRVPLDDIINRQSQLAGDYDLFKPEGDTGWKAGVFADRAAFVRAFYAYARANPNGQPQLWSEWLKTSGG
jgi:hypothetical protein